VVIARRDFLQQAAAAVVAARLASRAQPSSPASHARRLERIGLELYTVRDAMRRDPDATLAAVRAMGYLDVELLWSFDNFGRTTSQVKAALDREGLRAPSAHIAPETIERDWDASLQTANTLGHQYLIVPSLPAETLHSLDAWRSWADRFNRAGEAARRANVWLAFHNEPDHMKPIDGVVPYDLFVERTAASVVRLQLDVGNMALGGGDPYAYLEQHRDRYWSFHLKDVVADSSRDTELGTGRLDFRRLLAMVSDLDRNPCYVEQEGPADPMASARADFLFLQGLEF
jgi:sugar phosphate isomerase/epimerase